MRSSWGEPTKSSVAPAKPTWPAGFDFGRLYADQDGAGAAQLRFADQVQVWPSSRKEVYKFRKVFL